MYQRILVPLDGSELAEKVLPHVEAMARAFKAESVTFVRVLEHIHMPRVEGDAVVSSEEWSKIESAHDLAARKYLDNLKKKINWTGIDIRAVILPPADVADMINKFAHENKMDLIVIATHGRSGVSRWLLGSEAEKILRSSSAPVLTIRVSGKA